METTKTTRKTSPVKINYVVDLLIFIAFLVAFDPRGTGLAIHEWLGVAFGAAIVGHLLLHWKWIAASTRRFLGRLPRPTLVNYVLNTLLFVATTVLVFSGLMISEVALPAFGLRLGEGFAWRALHEQSGDAVLILLGLHVALHWKWIASTTGRYVVAPIVARWPRRARRPLPVPAELSTEETPA